MISAVPAWPTPPHLLGKLGRGGRAVRILVHTGCAVLKFGLPVIRPVPETSEVSVLVVERPVGPLAANCYVVATGPDAPCVVIDPGQDAEEPVADIVAEHRLQPAAVLLTHGHFDHVWSAAALSSHYGIPVHIHPDDAALLSDPAKGLDPGLAAQLSSLFGAAEPKEPDNLLHLAADQSLTVAGLTFTVEHAPGHTPGSVTFALPAQGQEGGQELESAPILFSGDLLFSGSIGRTDFPGGDHQAMTRSLARVCLARPDQTVVYPGHGPSTTIGRERVSNPFLQGLPS